MAIVKFDEKPNAARLLTRQDETTYDTAYIVEGEDNASIVEFNALNLIPLVKTTQTAIVYRQEVATQRIGYKLYEAHVTYSSHKKPDWEWSIDGTSVGGTQHILRGYEEVAKFPAPGVTGLADCGAMIGVNEGEIEGADIPVPVLNMRIRVVVPKGVLTPNYARNIGRCTAKYNNATWCGFAPGEALYLGADFSDGSNAPVEVIHHIAFNENIDDETIAGVPGVSKKGWDIQWTAHRRKVDSARPTREVMGIYVVRALKTVNLAAVLGFGG